MESLQETKRRVNEKHNILTRKVGRFKEIILSRS